MCCWIDSTALHRVEWCTPILLQSRWVPYQKVVCPVLPYSVFGEWLHIFCLHYCIDMLLQGFVCERKASISKFEAIVDDLLFFFSSEPCIYFSIELCGAPTTTQVTSNSCWTHNNWFPFPSPFFLNFSTDGSCSLLCFLWLGLVFLTVLNSLLDCLLLLFLGLEFFFLQQMLQCQAYWRFTVYEDGCLTLRLKFC